MAVGDPTGADLTSGTTNGNTLPEAPTAPEEREITFGAGVELTSGVKYAIVVKAPGASNFFDGLWSLQFIGSYADGDYRSSNDSGSSWSTASTKDLYFKTYATAALKDSHTFSPGANDAPVGGATQASQSFTASSTYTITSVKLNLRRSGGESPGTITVSIKATVGAPTKATNPTPSNAAADVTLNQATITWEDGGGADTYDVYYGDTSGSLVKVSDAQAGLSLTITGIDDGSPFNYIVTRYWRIDSTNTAGTTTGDEWSFTTIRFSPVGVTSFYYTTGQYYRLLVQSDGSYGDVPGVGVENTDYVFLAVGYEANFIRTVRKLVGIANSKVWVEDI